MKKDVILVLTHEKDGSADMVIERLIERQVRFARLNTEYFHAKYSYVSHLDKNGHFNAKFVFNNGVVIDFDEIGVVWNRRIHLPRVSQELAYDPKLQNWAGEETDYAMRTAFTLFQCPVINPIVENEHIAYNKMLQMRKAAEIGFEVPLSIITDIPSQIKSFWAESEQKVIFKKIKASYMEDDNGQALLLHTSRLPISEQTDETIQRMRFAPVFMQEEIPKKYDVRVMVVGEKIFSFAIHSQETKDGKVDYRTQLILNGGAKSIRHEAIDLGPEVNRKLLEFCKVYNLKFSAIDLVVTPDDRVIFLEDNPNGQWGWLEILTGAPISSAIADTLIQTLGE